MHYLNMCIDKPVLVCIQASGCPHERLSELKTYVNDKDFYATTPIRETEVLVWKMDSSIMSLSIRTR